jgi:hypothetical protein
MSLDKVNILFTLVCLILLPFPFDLFYVFPQIYNLFNLAEKADFKENISLSWSCRSRYFAVKLFGYVFMSILSLELLQTNYSLFHRIISR